MRMAGERAPSNQLCVSFTLSRSLSLSLALSHSLSLSLTLSRFLSLSLSFSRFLSLSSSPSFSLSLAFSLSPSLSFPLSSPSPAESMRVRLTRLEWVLTRSCRFLQITTSSCFEFLLVWVSWTSHELAPTCTNSYELARTRSHLLWLAVYIYIYTYIEICFYTFIYTRESRGHVNIDRL